MLLNLKNTNFVTPHGLDNEKHYTTALELAKITDYALNIENNYNLLSKIDFVFAKSEYSIKHKLTKPNFINIENTLEKNANVNSYLLE